MYNIRTLNQISHIGLKKLPTSEFIISEIGRASCRERV